MALPLSVGRSLVEDDKLDAARDILARAKARGVTLLLPQDHVVVSAQSAEQLPVARLVEAQVSLGRRLAARGFLESADDVFHLAVSDVMAWLRGACDGRGLDALLGGDEAPREAMLTLPVARIRPGKYQPRTKMDQQALAELAASIRSQGMMQPLLVRPVGEGYELIAGERRWRAAQMAGLHTVPVIVRELADREVLELAIIENVQRADLNAIEEAEAYAVLLEEHGQTQEEIAARVGKERSTIANAVAAASAGFVLPTLVELGSALRFRGHAGESPRRRVGLVAALWWLQTTALRREQERAFGLAAQAAAAAKAADAPTLPSVEVVGIPQETGR